MAKQFENKNGSSIDEEKKYRMNTHMIERSRFISAQITPQQQFKLIRFSFSLFFSFFFFYVVALSIVTLSYGSQLG